MQRAGCFWGELGRGVLQPFPRPCCRPSSLNRLLSVGTRADNLLLLMFRNSILSAVCKAFLFLSIKKKKKEKLNKSSQNCRTQVETQVERGHQMPRMVNVNNHVLRHMTSKYQNTGGKRRVPQASEFHTQDQEAEWLKT